MRGRHPKVGGELAGSKPPVHVKAPALSPPEHLKGYERTAFRKIVRWLSSTDLLDGADAGIVELAALHYARMREAGNSVRANGVSYEVTRYGRNDIEWNEICVNPSVKVEREAGNAFRMCCEQLGLTPVSRLRIAAAGGQGHTGAGVLSDDDDDTPEAVPLRSVG